MIATLRISRGQDEEKKVVEGNVSLSFEAGLMVQNGQIRRIQGTAYDKESEKVMGAWAEVKTEKKIHYTTVAYEKIDLDELVAKAIEKAITEMKVTTLAELERYVVSLKRR